MAAGQPHRINYLVSRSGMPIAVATLSDRPRQFATQLDVHRRAADRRFGPRLRIPTLLAHLERGWLADRPDIEGVVTEYVAGVGSTEIRSDNLSTVLTGLADLYVGSWRDEPSAVDAEPPARPEPDALSQLAGAPTSTSMTRHGPYDDRSHQRLLRLAAQESELYAAVRADADCLIHGDLWYRNIAMCGGRLTLIDWEHAHFGNIGADLAHLWLMSPRLPDQVATADAAFRELAGLMPQGQVYLASWRRAFDAYLLLEGTRVLWGPLLRCVQGPRPALTGEQSTTDKVRAAQRISDALAEVENSDRWSVRA